MIVIYLLTAALLALSFLANRERTTRALRIASKRFLGIAPSFVLMLVLVSVALVLLPERVMLRALAPEGKWGAAGAAVALGSVSVMPGFIAFPLCGVLLERGALYMVLSAFSTTLMMVGVVSYPLERHYLGDALALARNAASFVVALAVALATGFVFGELP